MSIQGINSNSVYTKKEDIKAQPAAQSEADAKAEQKQTKAADTVQISGSTGSVTYSKQASYSKEVEEIKSDYERRQDQFIELLRSMITKQGEKSNLSMLGKSFTVSQQQSADAAKAISEGGEYSVNAVADRIMKMAESLSGGDVTKYSALRDAVKQGFAEAEKAWGGKLPGICGDTYDECMKRFDEIDKKYGLNSTETE